MRESALKTIGEIKNIGKQIDELSKRRDVLVASVLVPGLCLKLKNGEVHGIFRLYELDGGLRAHTVKHDGTGDYDALTMLGNTIDVRYDLFEEQEMERLSERLKDAWGKNKEVQNEH